MSQCNICGAPIFSNEPVTDQPCLDCIMEPLSDLIDKTIAMLLRADGDRDHMNHSDITCEQSMGVVQILRMCRSAITNTNGHCPNGIENCNCLFPDCVRSCAGRPALSHADSKGPL